MSKEYPIYEYKLVIQETHLDVFGHLNNANYLQLYEQARWDFITKNGYGLEAIKERQIGPVLLSAHVTFRREILARETITITSQFAGEINGRVSKLHQEMVKENGKVASTLDIEAALFDMKERKMIPPTDDWKRALGVI